MLSEKQLEQRRTNLRAANEKRRSKTHCSKGHKITGRAKDGSRFCETCASDSKKRSKIRILFVMENDRTDKRHGTYYGYWIGCRCFRCRLARYNARTEVA